MKEENMRKSRRAFGKMVLAAGAGLTMPWEPGAFAAERPLGRGPSGIKIGTRLDPQASEEDLSFFSRLGIEYATIWTSMENAHYEYFAAMRRKLESRGIQVWNIGILDLHCDPAMVLGLEDRDEKVERYKRYLKDLSRAGIHYTTYAHMANIKMRAYYMTGEAASRGGVPTREFDLEAAQQLPLSHGRIYREEEIWKTFSHFIRQVLPVAERVGVRIGLHPDDPPVPSLGGVARVFTNYAALQRALELADSDNFGICLCLGTWAEGGKDMGKDVTEVIRALGSLGRLFKIHMRNIDRPLPTFRETFIDTGYLDMPRIMRALHEVGFDGVVIPDHVPGEGLRGEHTAYTIGYLKALRDMAQRSE